MTITIPERTFDYPVNWGDSLSPNVVGDLTENFNGQVGFDCRNKLRDNSAVLSAVASIAPSGPTVGTVMYADDRLTVLVPLNNLTADTEYILTLTVTSQSGDVFDIRGQINVG